MAVVWMLLSDAAACSRIRCSHLDVARGHIKLDIQIGWNHPSIMCDPLLQFVVLSLHSSLLRLQLIDLLLQCMQLSTRPVVASVVIIGNATLTLLQSSGYLINRHLAAEINGRLNNMFFLTSICFLGKLAYSGCR